MPTPAAAIFSLLLVITGVAKLRHPGDTAAALRMLRLPLDRPITIALGVTEMLVGLTTLTTGSAELLVAQGVLYGMFLIWVLVAMMSGAPIASCGCVGRDDTPPYWGHLVLNAVAVASSIAASTMPSVRTPVVQLGAGLVVTAVGAWLAWRVLDEGARIHGLVHR